MNIHKKQLYRIINEELSDFDFLSMDKFSKMKKTDSLLSSKEFQTKLINDLLFNNNKYILNDSAHYIELNEDLFEYSKEFDYSFNGEKQPIYLRIEGDHDDYVASDIIFFGSDGVKLDFKWLEKNEPLKKKFVEKLVSPYKKD